MIAFAPAKINIGLSITGKRVDGYHEIESLMVQVPLYDIIEITKSKTFSFYSSGIKIPKGSTNLCEQAFRLLEKKYNIEPVSIHLRKQIPIGAGLGGGSSDAAHVLKALNTLYNLKMSEVELQEMSSLLGSDCPLFIHSHPQFASGRGEILKAFKVDLSEKYLCILNPKIHISTAEAYGLIRHYSKANELEENLKKSIELWPEQIKNDFEIALENKYPILNQIKTKLYQKGAQYASMSGSGSSVYGIFNHPIHFNSTDFKDFLIYEGKFDVNFL